MPTIRMLKTGAGPEGVRMSGGIYTVTDKEAKDLLEDCAAIVVKDSKVEASVLPAAETAELPVKGRGKRK